MTNKPSNLTIMIQIANMNNYGSSSWKFCLFKIINEQIILT